MQHNVPVDGPEGPEDPQHPQDLHHRDGSRTEHLQRFENLKLWRTVPFIHALNGLYPPKICVFYGKIYYPT